MASISTDPNGNRAIQFVAGDSKRRTVRLGKITKKTAQEIKLKIESLNAAKVSGMPLAGAPARRLGEIGDDLAKKRAAVGLAANRETGTLNAFLTNYIDGRTDVKAWTRVILHGGRRRMVEYFGPTVALRAITKASADAYVVHLRGKYAGATAGRDIKRCRQFFAAARRARLVSENPFDGIKPGAMHNSDRAFFVTREMATSILEACPDAEWRAIFALARFGGLRCPSELQHLKWGDIDWERGLFHVHSPKSEHTLKARRRVPLFSELRPHLEALFDEALVGSVHVIPRTLKRDTNLRTHFERIIHWAGLTPWTRPSQNCRASRQTELAAEHPLHVVCDWIGNSAAIASKHYLRVRQSDFDAALQSAAERCRALQSVAERCRALQSGAHSMDRR